MKQIHSSSAFRLLALFVFFVMPLPVLCQNVGIGITNPTRAKLEVNGAVGITSAIFGGESSGISLQRNWPGIGFNQYYSGASKYIGTGYAAVQYLDPTAGYMAFDMFGSGNSNSIAATPVRAMTIGNNGNIGIGIGPTNATLCVVKGNNVEGSAIFGGSVYNSHFNYGINEDTYIRAGRPLSDLYLNDISGGKIMMGGGTTKVGINTGNPQYTLELVQTGGKGIVLVEPTFGYANWEILVANPAGSPCCTGWLGFKFNGTAKSFIRSTDGSYYVFSDRRLKTNIQKLPRIMDKVMRLQPVKYEMNVDNPSHEKSIGFIAQDVRRLFPELVSEVKDSVTGVQQAGKLHTLNYSGFGVLAIKAIQEQQKEIDDLKKVNAGILAEMNELKQLIKQISL